MPIRGWEVCVGGGGHGGIEGIRSMEAVRASPQDDS